MVWADPATAVRVRVNQTISNMKQPPDTNAVRLDLKALRLLLLLLGLSEPNLGKNNLLP
jgi:hypothetical protein